ncbi:hypothetical protein [Sulfurovum sp.]|uniref:hypothetical protein n=1 Tax=Sulfurovum sp. TaxID=1969726 RepID=UPI00356A2D2F
MSSNNLYIIEPSPDSDYIIKLAEQLSKDGYRLLSTTKDVLLFTEMKQVLLDESVTDILSRELLTEAVLPDSTPRNAVLDTLKYKLNRCTATNSLLIVDPYLYPANYDTDYINDFISVFRESLQQCSKLSIATLSNRNTTLEQLLDSEIQLINPQISIEKKYTNVFHDRFWIADNTKGVFVGTSLNGIGKRYAVIDYLHENDANDIVQRYSQIP